MSSKILDAAVALAMTFDTNDSLALVKRFLGPQFPMCSHGLDDGRALDVISRASIGSSFRKIASPYPNL